MLRGFEWMIGACFGALAFWALFIAAVYGIALVSAGINVTWSYIKKFAKKFKKSLQKDQK